MRRPEMRDFLWLVMAGDTVFAIPHGITTDRPYDDSELGERIGRAFESEGLGWSALQDVTCQDCRRFMPKGGQLLVCDECRPALLARIRGTA